MYEQLAELVVEQAATIRRLEDRVSELEVEVAELKRRLSANSRNSSRPPSSDGLSKPPTRKSLRRRSGRKPGGQPGSEGHHLAQVAEPDRVVPHEPKRCEGCGGDLVGAELSGVERRQVFDLPPETRLEVDEHQAVRRRCRCCGALNVGVFPDSVRAPASYGPRLRAFVLYLSVYQHVPYERIATLLADRYGVRLSTGTLRNIVAAGAAGLGRFLDELRGQLVGSPVVHLDETGARAAGKLHWVHEATTGTLALYGRHERRGKQGIDALGVLPGFTGVAVHDGFTPYRRYEGCTHALCNAHHLRELAGAEERGGQPWAADMARLLIEIKDTVQAAKDAGRQALDPDILDCYRSRYREIITVGYLLNPEPERNRQTRPAQTRHDTQPAAPP